MTLFPSFVLSAEKWTRDFLGGRNVQGSDKYARVVELRVLNMQISVLNAIEAPGGNDPTAEFESLQEFAEFFLQLRVACEQRLCLVRAISNGSSGQRSPSSARFKCGTNMTKRAHSSPIVVPNELNFARRCAQVFVSRGVGASFPPIQCASCASRTRMAIPMSPMPILGCRLLSG